VSWAICSKKKLEFKLKLMLPFHDADRLPLKTARRTVILGGSMGALISLLSVAQGRLNEVRAGLAVEAAKKEREAVERENASGRR
jgi:alpha-beta hydrolase superfamily lysophospholipase